MKYVKSDIFYNASCSVRLVKRQAAAWNYIPRAHTGPSALWTHLSSLLVLPNLRCRKFTEEQKLRVCQRQANSQGEAEFKLCS